MSFLLYWTQLKPNLKNIFLLPHEYVWMMLDINQFLIVTFCQLIRSIRMNSSKYVTINEIKQILQNVTSVSVYNNTKRTTFLIRLLIQTNVMFFIKWTHCRIKIWHCFYWISWEKVKVNQQHKTTMTLHLGASCFHSDPPNPD